MNRKEIHIMDHFKDRNYFDADTHILKFLPETMQLVFCFTDYGEMLSGMLGMDPKLPYRYRIVTFVFDGVKEFRHEEFRPIKPCGRPGEVYNYGKDAVHFMANFVTVEQLGTEYQCEMDFERGLGQVQFKFQSLEYFELKLYGMEMRDGRLFEFVDAECKNGIFVEEYIAAIDADYRSVMSTGM